MARNIIFLATATFATASLQADNGCFPSIDCEGYRPAFSDHLSCGFFGEVGFHYFYGRESELTPLARLRSAEVGTVGIPDQDQGPVIDTIPKKFVQLPVNWDAGFRVGVGFNSPCSYWQLQLTWSFFQNESKVLSTTPLTPSSLETFANPPEEFVSSSWIRTDALDKQIDAFWRFRLNRLDLTSSYEYCVSPRLSLTPQMGISGFWSDTSMRVTMKEATAFNFFTALPISFDTNRTLQENCVWGGGFFTSLDTNFFIGRGFSVYSNLALSLYWGRDRYRDAYEILRLDYESTGDILPILEGVFPYERDNYGMQPVFALSLGLSQSSEWCDGRYQSTAQIGWENQIWYSLNERYSYYNPTSLIPVAGDLMMGGLVIRGRFDF